MEEVTTMPYKGGGGGVDCGISSNKQNFDNNIHRLTNTNNNNDSNNNNHNNNNTTNTPITPITATLTTIIPPPVSRPVLIQRQQQQQQQQQQKLPLSSVSPVSQPSSLNRSSFPKSHTCGSLYAKCTCSSVNNSETISPKTPDREKRRATLLHTFSHPDTAFIFTKENKKPPPLNRVHSVISTRNGKVEISRPKRLSSPNIGNYALVDVAVHPEVVLKVSTNKNVVSGSHKSCQTPTSNDKNGNENDDIIDGDIVNKDAVDCVIEDDNDDDDEDTLDFCYNDPIQPPLKAQTTNIRSDSLSSEYSSGSFNSHCSHSLNKSESEEDNLNPSPDFKVPDIAPPNSLASPSGFNPTFDFTNKFPPEKKHSGKYFIQDFDFIVGCASDVGSDLTKYTQNLDYHKLNALSYQQIPKEQNGINSENTNDLGGNGCDSSDIERAQKFFEESGILGPMGNGACYLRKQSKIGPDVTNIEQIRKGSRIIKQSIVEAAHRKSLQEDYNINNRNIVTNLKLELKSWQDKTINLQDELLQVKDFLIQRENEISKLKREIHKLKSVLQQTTNHMRLGDGDLLSSIQTHHCMAGQNIVSAACNKIINNDCKCNEVKQNLKLLSAPAAVKKQGVSGESSDATGHQSSDIKIPKYDKDFTSKQLIKDSIMENDFLKNIDSTQVRELVDSMYSRDVAKGEYVIREGEAGAHLYVAADGEFEVIKDGKVLGIMGPGKAFGELAILYNCTRTASIRVLSDSRVWVLDRRIFQQIMMRTGLQRIEENVNFLRSVPLLKNLNNDVLSKIADVLEVEFYPAGTYIIRQGASGDTFFLISQGNVKVTQRFQENSSEKEIRTLRRGDYFGEQALIKEDKRTANIIALSPGVECLTLDRVSFTQLIGDLSELHEKDYGDEDRILLSPQLYERAASFETTTSQELLDVDLTDLERVATLGVGGFGRVELVQYKKDTNELRAYALKCLKKQHIVDTRQEDHVFSERTIMLSCNTPFICRLYRTYRDNKYVYMLLEACMGGEIWTILRDKGCFNDHTTQFIIGCVLQAFEYLHARGIVYRDLKPENLMLDTSGYVKLVDFGFAKFIGYSNKTWTFCGTPEYVAPEIVLNKGHDRAVDYWALGILIHELLTGTPPFTASDPMKTYNIILKGIDMVDFPRHMSRSAISLIKRLCRDAPAERLGYQKSGIQDIKKHKWFQGFDWDGLSNRTLMPPIYHTVQNALDTSYFDLFPADTDEPPDEMSGWDADF